MLLVQRNLQVDSKVEEQCMLQHSSVQVKVVCALVRVNVNDDDARENVQVEDLIATCVIEQRQVEEVKLKEEVVFVDLL